MKLFLLWQDKLLQIFERPKNVLIIRARYILRTFDQFTIIAFNYPLFIYPESASLKEQFSEKTIERPYLSSFQSFLLIDFSFFSYLFLCTEVSIITSRQKTSRTGTDSQTFAISPHFPVRSIEMPESDRLSDSTDNISDISEKSEEHKEVSKKLNKLLPDFKIFQSYQKILQDSL